MRLITKVDQGCVALETDHGHAFIYAADGAGTIHVLGQQGERVHTKLKNPEGAHDLYLMKGGLRLLYTGHGRTFAAWREVKQSGRFPPGGAMPFPAGESAVTAVTVCPFGRKVLAGHANGTVGVFAFGEMGRRENRLSYRCNFETPDGTPVTALGVIGDLRSFAVAGYGAKADLFILNGDSAPTYVSTINTGLPLMAIARTRQNVVYSTLAQGRLLKVVVTEGQGDGEDAYYPTLSAPDVVRVPGEPTLTALAVSPCGGYLAVGANFADEYGGVLLYDAADMRPLAMFDTPAEPTGLVFAEFNVVDPDTLEGSTELTLFSGHDNGHIIKWHISRQLQWLSRITERPTRRSSEPTGPDFSAGAPERALDL